MMHRGLQLHGWVANIIDPNMLKIDENIATLKKYIKAPCLGAVGFMQKAEDILILDDTSITG
jgi:dethiobiotin synthetase